MNQIEPFQMNQIFVLNNPEWIDISLKNKSNQTFRNESKFAIKWWVDILLNK